MSKGVLGANSTPTIIAGMGEIKVVRCPPGKPAFLKVTVGSCIGFYLADMKNYICGLAHVMLPEKIKEDDTIGKYADTALPELVRQVGGDLDSIRAYIIGGACMFGPDSSSFIANVGKRNIEAVLKIAETLRIPIVYNDTGGYHGRTAIFNCQDSTISVKALRKIAYSPDRGSN